MSEQFPPHNPDDLDDTSRSDANRTRAYQPRDAQGRPLPPRRTDEFRQTGYVIERRNRPQRGGQSEKRNSGFYLPIWTLAILLILVLFVSFGIVAIVMSVGGNILSESTPIVRIITAEPSLTPVPQVIEQSSSANTGGQVLDTILATATLPASVSNNPDIVLSGPTLAPFIPTATPETISIGKQVVVFGVGDNELNIRDEPGTIESTVIFREPEGTVFNVIAGPNQADGFTWWRIQDPVDASRTGWAAANFLQVAP